MCRRTIALNSQNSDPFTCPLCRGDGWKRGDGPSITSFCEFCGGAGFFDSDEWSVCWSHHRLEARPQKAYKICPECFHVYRTRWHLAWSWLRNAPVDERPLRDRWDLWPQAFMPSRIHFCQYCIHDF